MPRAIFARWVLDGRGGVTPNATVFIENGRITRITPGRAANATLAFPDGTLLPGLIDVHAHPASYERAGRLRGLGDGDSAHLAQPLVADNLRRTLAAGFTTIQSIGAAADVPLRDALARGDLSGPRLITALNAITDASLTDSLRAIVRARHRNGAQAIKLFASRGLGDGGAPTMTVEQLTAICGEAQSLGLRSIVHAHSAESIRRAITAGCTQLEHGVFVTQDVLTLMAEKGTWFDPQCAGVFQNYLDHRTAWFAGGSYATPLRATPPRLVWAARSEASRPDTPPT